MKQLKFAPVAPVHMLELMHPDHLGDYHLILAHDVAEKGERYKKIFERLYNEGFDPFIIMDNSVIELGHPVGREVMEEACRWVRPSCLVLPDVMKNKNETLKLLRSTLQDWRKSPFLEGIPFMAVPQGKTLVELLACAGEMHNMLADELKYWGFGKFVQELLGSRRPLVAQMVKMEYIWRTNRRFHMLGFGDKDIGDDIAICRDYRDHIMGIDSAVPLRMGQKGVLIELTGNPVEPRGDFWTRPVEWIEPATQHNLDNIRSWLNCESA